MPKPYSFNPHFPFSIPHSLLTAAIFLATTLVFVQSCRKMDRVATSSTAKETEAKFFNNHRSADAREKALVDFLKRKNNSLHFVQTTVERIGYPRWDKAFTVTNDNIIANRTESGDDNAAITYIPFVRDNEKHVNASLLIKTSASDTVFRYLLDWQYASYGFDTTSTGWNARDVFHVFARMNKQVFGQTAFRITDDRLFGAAPAGKEVIVKIRTDETLLRTESNSFTSCVYDDICYNPPGGNRCETCTVDCPQYVYTAEKCTTYWVEYDWFPGSGGGGGGETGGGGNPGDGDGSSGGGNGTPPQCDPNGQPPSGQGPCNSGWEEEMPADDGPPQPPPCDSYITALGNDLNFANYFKSLADTSVINLNYEKGFYVADRIGNNYLAVQGNPGSPVINFYNVTLPTDGILHSHYGGLNPMFSPDDVLMMAKIFLNGLAKDSNNLFFGMTHSYGPPYLLKVTNVAKFRKFAERIVKMQENPGKGKTFKDEYNDKLKFDVPEMNERGFLNMLNWEKAGNGLTLYRAADKDCRKWKKLERDGFNQTGVIETPCN